ncbi:MAG TPA: PP2C family protein-serine/threonine phosphatase [Terracidiphilus sp.]|nr:PP2C family protein-serine/threonine phosphatase [Terracidiphilus sp.]
MRQRDLALSLIFLGMAFVASAQDFDLESGRVRMADVDGLWRFHTGDDADGKLGWANPSLDDSKWPLLRSDRSWNAQQGYQDYSGFGWYRFRLEVPDGSRTYGLYLPSFATSFQVFGNGTLLGTWGGLPPHQRQDIIPPLLLQLPAAQPDGSLVIAIRTWGYLYGSGTGEFGAGPGVAPRFGEFDTLREWAFLQDKQAFWNASSELFLAMGWLIVGIAGMALYLFRRSEREHLWFALTGFFWAADLALHSLGRHRFFTVERFSLQEVSGLAEAGWRMTLLFLIWHLLSVRRNRLFYVALGSVIASFLVICAGNGIQAFGPGALPANVMGYWNFVIAIPVYVYWICVLFGVLAAAYRSVSDAHLLLFPVFFEGISHLLSNSFWALLFFDLKRVQPLAMRFWLLSDWPFPLGVPFISNLILQLSLIGILVLRFNRSSVHEQRLVTEMESAREVQLQLVPRDLPRAEYACLESAYLPAAEVGGDFYQVIELGDRSLLIVVGDVSGKGLKAAMKGTLAIGAIRALVAENTRPAELLFRLNSELLLGKDGGFITCVCAHLSPNGVLTLANAGHIPPYINGWEVECNSGLPLGILKAEYGETTIHLVPDDRMVLLSDGVLEAQNAKGELLGFDRIAALSRQSADQIARAALQFGQEDDITVLALIFTGSGVLRA